MSSNEKKARRTWTRLEIQLLLKCYLARKDEFQHSRKKKHAFAHVLEDMVFQGLEDQSITVSAVEGKMKTLLSAYKNAKDNRSQTGASPTIIPYMDELEEIFGDKPIISNNHTIHLGGYPVSPLLTQCEVQSLVFETQPEPDMSVLAPEEPMVEEWLLPLSPNQDVPLPSSSSSSSSSRKMLRKEKVKYADEKKNYLNKKLKLKSEFLTVVREGLEEKWRQELIVLKSSEEKKIKLLEDILKKQS